MQPDVRLAMLPSLLVLQVAEGFCGTQLTEPSRCVYISMSLWSCTRHGLSGVSCLFLRHINLI